MSRRAVPRLHIVTDDDVLARRGFVSLAERVLRAGGPGVALHLRGPHTSGAVVYQVAVALSEVAGEAGAVLVVNDRVDVVLGLGSRAGTAEGVGVHLGRRSLPPRVARAMVGEETLVGSSVHGVDELDEALEGGADYVVFGHVFPTRSHPGKPATGVQAIRACARAAGQVPVLAIGGIGVREVGECLEAGAHGVAVLRGVWEAPAPEDAAKDYISALARRPKRAGGGKESGGLLDDE